MLMCLAYHVAEKKIEGDSKRGEEGDEGNTQLRDSPPQLQSVDCDANGAARHSPSHNNSMGGNLIAAFSDEDLQSLGIEYELTDYILLNDIEEEIHSQRSFYSLNSTNSLSSIDPPYTIDAPPPSEDDLTYSDAATSTKLSKQHSRLSSKSSNISKQQYSVYDNFDDLFEIRDSWMTNNGSSFIGSQWEGVAFDTETRDDCADVIVKGGDLELQGSSYTTAEEKGDPTTSDTRTSPTNNGVVGSNGSESAEILKNLVIKCLVRNNCRGGVSGVKGGKIPRGVADRSRGGTKFMTSYGGSLPRDPSIVSHTSSRYHGSEDPTNKRQSEDPPDSEEMKREHQYEQMQIYMMHRAHGNHMVVESGMHQHNNGGSSVVPNGSRQYPPRSDIVRYGNNIGNNTSMNIQPLSPNYAMLSRQQRYKRWLKELDESSPKTIASDREQPQQSPTQQPPPQQQPHPDIIRYNASAPLNTCYSSYSYSTNAYQTSRSLGSPPSLLPGGGQSSFQYPMTSGRAFGERVEESSQMRRKRYKELLLKQKQHQQGGVAVAQEPLSIATN